MITWRNQAEFTRTLAEYAAASRKVPGDVIANEAKWFAMGLRDEFAKLSATPQSIASAVASRRFKMGRRSNDFTRAERGVSAAAIARARKLMEGRKSEWFKVSMNQDGVPTVKLARFSARKGNKLLRGGRFGNKFAAGALRAFQTQSTTQQLRDQGLNRLNERALAVAIETAYRARSAKGHFLGVQWLPQVYKTRSSALVKKGPLVVNSRDGKRIGEVQFSTDSQGELQAIRLVGSLPGTAAVASRGNIVERVTAARIADRRAYIQRKMDEAKQKAGVNR